MALKQKGQAQWYLIAIIALVVIAGVGTLFYTGILSFVGGVESHPHTLTASDGENITAILTSNFATGQTLNTPSPGRGCPITTTDTSTNTTVSLSSSTSNYATSCSYNLQTSITLKDMDITKYESITIKRKGTISIIWSDWGYYATTSIDGVTSGEGAQTPTAAGFPYRRTSTSLGLGEVKIVKTGPGIYTLYANPEAPTGFLITNPKSFTFKNTVSTRSEDNMGQSIEISGIDLTPTPGTILPPVTPPPTCTSLVACPPGPGPTPPTTSWWDNIYNWLKALFGY